MRKVEKLKGFAAIKCKEDKTLFVAVKVRGYSLNSLHFKLCTLKLRCESRAGGVLTFHVCSIARRRLTLSCQGLVREFTIYIKILI